MTRQIVRQTEGETDTQPYRKTNGQAERQPSIQKDPQADEQMHIFTVTKRRDSRTDGQTER